MVRDYPAFMPFGIERHNGNSWVTVAWFCDYNEALITLEHLNEGCNHYRLINAQEE